MTKFRKLGQSITDLWDWLNTGQNYTEFKRAFEDIKKATAEAKEKVSYYTKIDKFLTAIETLKKVEKEKAERCKASVLKSAEALELCFFDEEIRNYLNELHSVNVNQATNTVAIIGTIK